MDNSQDINADTYPNAGRDSGYVAPIGENIVNVLTELLAALETKLLKSNIALTSRIDATVKEQDGRFSYVLNQLGAFLEKEDTRHDNWDAELGKILVATEEAARGLGKMNEEFESFRAESTARHDKSDLQRAVLSADVEDVRSALALLAADRDRLVMTVETLLADKARFEAFERSLAELSARIGGALPTEADQVLSAELREDAAERTSDGR